MASIHERPPEVLDRTVAGHWEGDLIKDAGNASAVGTLVERTSRCVWLVKLDGTDATAVLEGFTHRMRTLPASMRQTLTDDQVKEMAHHQKLARRLNIRVYFTDPHRPFETAPMRMYHILFILGFPDAFAMPQRGGVSDTCKGHSDLGDVRKRLY